MEEEARGDRVVVLTCQRVGTGHGSWVGKPKLGDRWGRSLEIIGVQSWDSKKFSLEFCEPNHIRKGRMLSLAANVEGVKEL